MSLGSEYAQGAGSQGIDSQGVDPQGARRAKNLDCPQAGNQERRCVGYDHGGQAQAGDQAPQQQRRAQAHDQAGDDSLGRLIRRTEWTAGPGGDPGPVF